MIAGNFYHRERGELRPLGGGADASDRGAGKANGTVPRTEEDLRKRADGAEMIRKHCAISAEGEKLLENAIRG